MKASIVDLRYKMNDVLKALDRRERVTITHHGKVKGFVRFSLLYVFMLLTACSMTDHVHPKYRSVQWSGSDPLNIPYHVRLSQFKEDNLVPNPSFEEDNVHKATSGNSNRIKGWEIVGENVKWVDRETPDYTQEDVNSGRHAVKILRKRANELDEAEGIISDYLKVVPGNYYFSYHIKLKYVTNNKYRLGVQLYDAVVIKVLFFDEKKQPIEPAVLNPVSRSLIDNSDKGYSFSNYGTIDEFPWAEVRGRTYNYPFSEGDVPDRTRYVRLFFGLKGIGAMWIDDIVYRYSKWNFTALERFKPYFAKPLTLTESIIPTPQSIQKINEIVYYDSTDSNVGLPVIVLPENPAQADFTAAKVLQGQISTVLKRLMPPQKFKRSEIRIFQSTDSLIDILNATLVFSIGRNKIYQQVQPHLPLTSVQDKPQGYVIKCVHVDNTSIAFLYGMTPLANYYAAATAIQLFDAHKAVYHNATVVDYPDFLGRSYVFKAWKNSEELKNDLNTISRMSLYKLNKVYLGFNRPGDTWHQADALYRRGIREAGQRCRESGVMSLAMMVNPYSHLGFETSAERISDQLKYRWTHSDPQSLEMLKNLYRHGLNAGAKTIMLLADDSVPHTGRNRQQYSLYTLEDKNRFVTLQYAQAHVINQLKQWLGREYPATRLEFCPPWYSNEHIDRSEGKAESYFRELTFQIPRDVAIIWTGPTVRSLSIDMADLYRYQSLIGRWPMLWDNTLYARNHEAPNYGGYPAHYPGKVRMCNLFEPLDTFRPKQYQNYNDGRQMYTNGAAYSEVYKIKYATVADYEWNTAAYNPELALWKALTRSYGRQVAEQLLRFNNAYYGVYDMCLRLKSEGTQSEYVKNAEKFIADMREYLINISTALPDRTQLIDELENFLDIQEKRLARTLNDLPDAKS